MLSCTETWSQKAGNAAGSTNLIIGVKQASSYSAEDGEGNWEANMLDGGPTNPSWMRITDDTQDSNGNWQGTYSDSNDKTTALSGQTAISTNGEVTCVSGDCPDSNLTSYADASKSVVVGTYGVSDTTPDAVLTVFTKMADSYSMDDLAGVWQYNTLSSPGPQSRSGTAIVNQNGTFTSSGKSGAFAISSDGVVTCTSGCGSDPTARATMNAGKTVMVWTDTPGTGSATIQIYTKSAGLPGAPTIGTVTPENDEAKVSFTPPASNGGSAVTGYTVTPYINGTATGSAASGSKSPISVKGLTNGTQYTFTVTATNKIGTGPASNPSNPPVTPATKPGVPTIGIVTAGSGQATVNFSAPQSDGGSPITGYSVNSNPKGGVDSNTNSTSLSHKVTNLKSGKKYTFTVTATNAVGTSTSKPSKPITIE